ncbi:MAG: HAD family hydrolase [Caldimicrobium sp.]
MKGLKLLVFDCDGVLFDSRLANREYYNFILEKSGRSPLTEEELEYVHMHSLSECIEYLFRNHPELKEKALKIAQNTPYSKFFKYMKMEEGLKEFLDWAYSRYYLALCTNRTTSTKPLLQYFGLENYFQLIRTALDIPKSDPKALASILEYFQVSPREALYVGDSKVDENLCLSCGVPLISFKNPHLKALRIISNFAELRSFLENSSFPKDGLFYSAGSQKSL